MEQKHVIIVNDGTFKEEDQEHYKIYIKMLRRIIECVLDG